MTRKKTRPPTHPAGEETRTNEDSSLKITNCKHDYTRGTWKKLKMRRPEFKRPLKTKHDTVFEKAVWKPSRNKQRSKPINLKNKGYIDFAHCTTYFTWLTFSNTFENVHSHKHRRLHAPSLFIPQRGKSSHMSPSPFHHHMWRTSSHQLSHKLFNSGS